LKPRKRRARVLWLTRLVVRIERHVIARGVFTSKADLARKLMRYIRAYNRSTAQRHSGSGSPRSGPAEGVAEFDWSREGVRLVYHTPGPGDQIFVRYSGQTARA
jgi:hypothetical protein